MVVSRCKETCHIASEVVISSDCWHDLTPVCRLQTKCLSGRNHSKGGFETNNAVGKEIRGSKYIFSLVELYYAIGCCRWMLPSESPKSGAGSMSSRERDK
jgi:hypothetical protein